MTGFGRSPATPDGSHPLDDDHTRNLRHYLRPVLDRWRVVAVCAAATVALAMVLALLQPREYRATATLQIERRGPDVVTFQEVVNVDPSYMAYADFYQTQHRLLQSRAVLRLVAQGIDLPNRPEYASRRPAPIERMLGWVFSILSSRETDDPAADPADGDPALDQAADYIAAGLSIKPMVNTRLVQVSFVDRSPGLARDIANEVVEAYEQFVLTARYDTTEKASEFLDKQVLALREEISAAEQALQRMSAERELLTVTRESTDVSSQALTELHAMLTEARGRLALAQARHDTAAQSPPEALPEVLQSPLITSLRQQYAELDRRHGQMSERFKPDWPALRQLTEEMERTEERLRLESEGIAAQVRSVALADLRKARAEVGALKARVASQKVEVRRVNRDAIEYVGLQSEIESKRRFLEELLARRSETLVSANLRDDKVSNIHLVDAAETPRGAVRPRKLMTLALSTFFGLLLGVGATLLLDHLDNTINNEHDIERYAGLPVLAQIPRRELPKYSLKPNRPRPESLDAVDMGAERDPQSSFAEAFKILRTSILLAAADQPPRHVVVTSPSPGAGKSVVSVNLAVVLAQLGRRVVLVDADLRRSRCHRILGVDNAIGLSNRLTGNASLESVILPTSVPGLSVIPSGPTPPAPAELLGGATIKPMLHRLTDEMGFDNVIIDSTPTLQIADSAIIAQHADATIVVVRPGHTVKESLTRAVTRLRRARVKLVGAVFNAVPERTAAYYGYYRYHRGGSKSPGTSFALVLARRKRRNRSA